VLVTRGQEVRILAETPHSIGRSVDEFNKTCA